MKINKHLTFSWGHIIAFVAIIIISYFSFLGLTYLTDGQFVLTGIGVVVIDAALIGVFIGAQSLKATTKKFQQRIVLERILVFVAPFVLVAAMYPACHFWTVFHNRTEIEDNFKDAVTGPRLMFEAYEEYCDNRLDSYSSLVNANPRISQVNKDNQILSLRLQLKDQNYEQLKSEVLDWVDNKAGKATVWNVFLIANIQSINNAITEWNSDLVDFSKCRLANESTDVLPFDSDSESLNSITSKLDKIKEIYKKKGSITMTALLMVLFCYLFLMLPYVIQRRNTKSIYHLFYMEDSFSERKQKALKTRKGKSSHSSLSNDEDDEYKSFTM